MGADVISLNHSLNILQETNRISSLRICNNSTTKIGIELIEKIITHLRKTFRSTSVEAILQLDNNQQIHTY